MTAHIDRRLVLKTGTFGLGALSLPGGALAAMQASLTPGFSHGVASGEPGPTSVLLWTRFVSDAPETKLDVEVWESGKPGTVIKAQAIASRARDHTAKVVIEGLKPGTRYKYRFYPPGGHGWEGSDTGNTRTLPIGKVSRYRMAVFSCSNMPFGWFNSYAHATSDDLEDDFDLVLHLGDYLYEYHRGNYPSAQDAVAGRLIEPGHEMVALADYRLRYASYRSDPDLQMLHQLYPMVAMWDDHEFTNDANKDGAQNHQPSEGDWADRKIAAERAYREWMPVRERTDDVWWSSYAIGDLAEIQLTESRVSGRSKQITFPPIEGDDAKRLELLKTVAPLIADPARTMLGAAQEQWLEGQFRANKTRWNIWAQQTIVGSLFQPQGMENWLPADAQLSIRERVMRGALAAKAGVPSNMDAWDGYPAARAKALSAAQSGNADLIVLTGDTHNGWAFDLTHDGKAAGVEFAGQGVTSPGLENTFKGATGPTIAKALMEANPGLAWADSSNRGYMVVELTPEKAVSEWRFTESILKRSDKLAGTARKTVLHGRRRIER